MGLFYNNYGLTASGSVPLELLGIFVFGSQQDQIAKSNVKVPLNA